MGSLDGEPKSIVEYHEMFLEYRETSTAEYHETSVAGYTFSATASKTYSPPMRIPYRPYGPNSHDTKPSPSSFVTKALSNTPIVAARSLDTASREAFATLAFDHEFQIIRPPPYDRSRVPWHQSTHVIFLLGRDMLAKYIPTFLYVWLCRYQHAPPHQNFDSADLRHLQEFNRVMKLVVTILMRWCTGDTSGRIIFEAHVVKAWNEGQQLFSNLIQSLLLAQSRAFAMTGRKETDAANWIRMGDPHEAEGKLFFRQLNDKRLGFNQVLSDFDRWNNGCWTWLGAPGSESLLF